MQDTQVIDFFVAWVGKGVKMQDIYNSLALDSHVSGTDQDWSQRLNDDNL